MQLSGSRACLAALIVPVGDLYPLEEESESDMVQRKEEEGNEQWKNNSSTGIYNKKFDRLKLYCSEYDRFKFEIRTFEM